MRPDQSKVATVVLVRRQVRIAVDIQVQIVAPIAVDTAVTAVTRERVMIGLDVAMTILVINAVVDHHVVVAIAHLAIVVLHQEVADVLVVTR